jgi:type I restriction enzyme, S subunit
VKRVDGLPSAWAIARIEEILASLSDGKTIHQGWSPLCEKQACETDDEWGVLKTTAIQPGEFQAQHHKRLPPHLSPRAYCEVFAGDLLLTCAGPRVRCGIPCLVRQTRPRLMLSGKMYRFRPQVGVVDPRFLEAFLLSEETQQIIDRMKTGGNESGLNLTHDRFRQLEFRFPSLPEQARIVDKLEELLSDLDAGVAELRAAQKKLAQYRQSLLKAAVEGQLSAAWREQNGEPEESGEQLSERILRERRARWEARQLAKFEAQGKAPPNGWHDKYPEPRRPSIDGLPALPESWAWATIDQLSPDDFKLGEWSDEEAAKFSVSTGDLLIARGNGSLKLVGRAGLVGEVSEQVAYPDTMIRLGLLQDIVRPAWIGLLWDSARTRDHIERQARTSAGIYKIAQPDIVSVIVPVPPLLEQDRLLDALARKAEELRVTEHSLDLGVRQATAQRKNILKAAFSGQLVPQDPKDEPASVLMERIRAEQAAREAGGHRGRPTKKAREPA